jgi:hypothetical protein
MLPLISVVLVILGALGIKRLLPRNRKRRRQVRFIRETLAANRTFDNRRVIASLSTVPDRINNLGPTIRSLLRQTRPPDEIVLAIPEFSLREQRPYVVPKYISRLPRVRFFATLGTFSLRLKDVRPCDGYGAATIERRRLPKKPKR